MSRRKKAIARHIMPDPKYNSREVMKFINRLMWDGKKSIAMSVVYKAIGILEERTGKPGLEVFLRAVDNVKPVVEVRSRRVGGATYQVPVEVRETRREALAMRWIIDAARGREGKPMEYRLADELLDAYNSTGVAFKKREDTHRMAEANKAFAHYRW
ncbi:30S ribosomal protein S7 [Spirochaeta thermophila]|uniref:Small ribosomal subunit protein uS7 n=2 Tax=Winmispira thermophila TaxID=154 RepID=G0GF96_WINT7|nr:30S ribosomal protein S7 [Spirochaeta thermophila]ADN01462.1 30S ribosomal protein S7 [Spirochaeta thermophila DSM 6192]AEJ60795.1 ribosomal protein S7 [Spirochaeta thermophila DSM 6578]